MEPSPPVESPPPIPGLGFAVGGMAACLAVTVTNPVCPVAIYQSFPEVHHRWHMVHITAFALNFT